MSAAKPTGPSRAAIVALVVSLGTLVTVSVMMMRSPDQKPGKGADSSDPATAAGEEPLKPGYVRIGGVQRPETDVTGKYDRDAVAFADDRGINLSYGVTPLVKANANQQAASVAEALATKSHPERLTPAILPAPFDPAKYEADPETYVNTIEPGRVFQSAQPGEGVFPLRTLTPRLLTIEQGQSVPLRVRATPGAPVTFTSFDLGQFENQLTSITVRADDKGIATARFVGSPGTINDVNILVASPVNSGQAKFAVNVELPRPAGAKEIGAGGV